MTNSPSCIDKKLTSKPPYHPAFPMKGANDVPLIKKESQTDAETPWKRWGKGLREAVLRKAIQAVTGTQEILRVAVNKINLGAAALFISVNERGMGR
jgi:hypothetical protein